jgi:hypothetical protein
LCLKYRVYSDFMRVVSASGATFAASLFDAMRDALGSALPSVNPFPLYIFLERREARMQSRPMRHAVFSGPSPDGAKRNPGLPANLAMRQRISCKPRV